MKALNYILSGILALSATSCGNDWLDLESSTEIPSEGSLETLDDFQYSLNGIYSAMQSSDGYTGRIVYYGDVTADDVQAASATKRTGSYYLLKYTKDNAPSTLWKIPYLLTRNANIILEEIGNIPETDKNKKERNDIIGQALTIRALSLFDLTRIYGYPYAKDNGASWGACIVQDVRTIDSKPARNTVAECYDAVIKDLTDAIPQLSEDFNYGKVNRWTAMALLSRVYLYKGDNQNALKISEEAIAGALKNKYHLWSNEHYPTAWADERSASDPGEVLFEIVNTTVDSPGKESMGYLCWRGGYSDMILTSSFYGLLTEDPDDVRSKVIEIYKAKAYINKYQPQKGENPADANVPLFRLSELYLNAAEAAVKLGNNAKAVEYLDPIVNRANPEKTVKGETITLERVLNERRKELFGEGHRLYDALRNNQTIERKDVKIDAIKSTKHLSMPDEAMKFDWNYYKVVLPIPKFEIDTNPNIAAQQNPGY